MATKIDSRVRFPSQRTAILKLRCSTCFCEYQDTENILFCDWLLYSPSHCTFYPDVVVHCTLIEMGVTITTGTLLKLSLRQDFNMASYRDLLMNVSQKVRYTVVLYAFLTWSSINARVNVVLNRTVVNSFWRFNNLCGSHLQSQLELYRVTWWYLTLVTDLIGKLSHDVISCVSVKLI